MVGVSYVIIVIYYLCEFVNCGEDCPKICACLGSYVDCSQKSLGTVPLNIPKWTLNLNLNNNRIRSLDNEQLKTLKQLSELKLNKNKLTKIPKDAFDNQKELKVLELNRNRLEDIEALTFKSLEKLLTLKLKRNRISHLKDGAFFGLSKIRSLVLDFNSIEVISKTWLYGLDKLKELSLAYNVINHIETEAWEFCQSLSILDLSNNRMKSVKTDTFKYLNDLTKLILDNNNITFIEEDAFYNTPNLQILQLNNNKISWTIEDANGVFSGLKNLRFFYLASNNIKSINKNAFSGLASVHTLDLDNNNITSVQQNAFTKLPTLEKLILNTTALLCDCNIKWFYEWLKTKKFNVYAVCSYPEWLRSQPLLDVPASNFTCDDLPKPRLIEEPEPEIMALKGENITLSCKAMSSAPSPMTFTWKKDNVELFNAVYSVVATSVDGKNTESTSVLNIFKVQHSDAGKYQCVVSNKYGTTYSQRSTISVLIFPTFVKIPSNITVEAGTTARLECGAHGEPQPEIAWQKDGGNDFPAARERRMHVMPTDDVFFITNAKPNDMGIYSCTAHNAAGTIVANATLMIEEMPSFVKPMEDKEITAGESAVLQCMASGAPKPTIQWLKDGDPIHATERHFFTAEDQLMIIVDTVVSDAGIYQCLLNNSLGVERGRSKLHVKPVLDVTNESAMLGIIIITVVCCAVGTSVCWVVIIYQTRKRMSSSKIITVHAEPTVLDFTDKTLTHFVDNTSEHSSCKDSGTGDSAKRSNDDLLPADEFTLIINENQPGDQPIRTASLVYLVSDGNNSHTPLLHKDTPSYPRSTNHDRFSQTSLSDSNKAVEDLPTDNAE